MNYSEMSSQNELNQRWCFSHITESCNDPHKVLMALKMAEFRPEDLINDAQIAQKDKFFDLTKGQIITLIYYSHAKTKGQ